MRGVNPLAIVLIAASSPQSHLLAVAHKGGAMGFLGHEHAVEAADWKAEIDYQSDPAKSSIKVRVPTATLDVDTERARKLAGLGKGPGKKDVEKIRQKMLGPDVLDAAKYPEIRFESTSVEFVGPEHFEVHGKLTMHGVTREETVRGQLSRNPFHARADFKIKQTDYGIKPVSIAGVVKVKNEVDLSIELREK
jgi:polyisoprenoid-binding protein YceI